MKNKKTDNEIDWESVLSKQMSFDKAIEDLSFVREQSIFEDIYDYFAYTVPFMFGDFIYEFKMKYQLLTKGYNDRQVWGFKTEMAELTVKLLTELKERKVGHPYGLTQKKWDKILGMIIDGFKAQIELDNGWELTPKQIKKLEDTWKVGMVLYTEWFANLWD